MIRRLHWPLVLLALGISLGLKLAVHEARQLTEMTITVPVRYNPPSEAMILNPHDEVKVRVSGQSSEIAELNPFNLEVEVSLTDDELGRIEITKDRMQVRTPVDLEVVSIEPDRFILEVESLLRRPLPIRVVLTGEPSAGASHGDPRVEPPTAKVVGPHSRVSRLHELTATVSLNGHAITWKETVTVISPDALVRVEEPRQVEVEVPMTVPGLETPLDELLDDDNTPDDDTQEGESTP